MVACTSPANKQGLQQAGRDRPWSGGPYCVATARPRKQHEKEGNKRNKAKRTTTAHLFFIRDELARQGHVSGRARLRLLQGRARGKKRVPSRCSRLVCKTAAGVRTPLLSNVSRSLTRVAPRRAIPFPTATSRWFDSRLRVVLRAPWAALMGTRAPVGSLASAPLPVWDGSHLTSPSCIPSSCSVRTFPSRPLPPPRAATPSGSHTTSRRIVPPRITFREDHLPTTISRPLGPLTYIAPPSFTKQLAETGPTSLPSHSGQTPEMVVLPRCHTDIRLRSPSSRLPLSNFLFSAPARLSQQWAV